MDDADVERSRGNSHRDRASGHRMDAAIEELVGPLQGSRKCERRSNDGDVRGVLETEPRARPPRLRKRPEPDQGDDAERQHRRGDKPQSARLHHRGPDGSGQPVRDGWNPDSAQPRSPDGQDDNGCRECSGDRTPRVLLLTPVGCRPGPLHIGHRRPQHTQRAACVGGGGGGSEDPHGIQGW